MENPSFAIALCSMLTVALCLLLFWPGYARAWGEAFARELTALKLYRLFPIPFLLHLMSFLLPLLAFEFV